MTKVEHLQLFLLLAHDGLDDLKGGETGPPAVQATAVAHLMLAAAMSERTLLLSSSSFVPSSAHDLVAWDWSLMPPPLFWASLLHVDAVAVGVPATFYVLYDRCRYSLLYRHYCNRPCP